jgi:hypothetical protein
MGQSQAAKQCLIYTESEHLCTSQCHQESRLAQGQPPENLTLLPWVWLSFAPPWLATGALSDNPKHAVYVRERKLHRHRHYVD